MSIKPLKLNTKDEFTFPKHPDLAPKNGTFFTNLTIGSRGQGKTYVNTQLMENLKPYYDKFIVISPSLDSDAKQKRFYEQLEREGKDVMIYDELDDSTIDEVIEGIKDDITEWRRYHKLYWIIQKIKKRGIDSLSSSEVGIIGEYLMDEDDDFKLDDILATFPKYYKPEYPPRTYLVIDDSFGSRMLENSRNNPLVKFLIRHRHVMCSISILVQSLSYVPRAIRSNSVLFIAFPTKSIKDKKVLYEELSGVFDSYEHFEEVMKLVASKDYSFLYADTSSMKSPDLRNGFTDKLNI